MKNKGLCPIFLAFNKIVTNIIAGHKIIEKVCCIFAKQILVEGLIKCILFLKGTSNKTGWSPRFYWNSGEGFRLLLSGPNLPRSGN